MMIILNDSKPQLTTGIMELSNMLTHVKLTTFLILLLIGANLVAEADKSVAFKSNDFNKTVGLLFGRRGRRQQTRHNRKFMMIFCQLVIFLRDEQILLL